jgi:Spy/CpxP family protein refolding chaperone
VNTWKAILAALVIFGAGFVTGNVLNRVSEQSKAVTSTPPRNTAHPQQTLPLEQLRRLELMGRVQKDLDLTPDQRARIEKVIGDGQERIRDLWDQVAPDIHDEYEDVKKKFCDVLTPDQKKRFEDLMKQQLHPHKPAATNAPPQAACEQKKSDV